MQQLAEMHDLPRYDDARQMLIDHPSRYVWLAGATGFRATDVRYAWQQQSSVLFTQPTADWADLDIRQVAGEHINPDAMVLLPMMRQSPGWRAAAEPHEALGEIRSMSIELLTGSGEQCDPQILGGRVLGRLIDGLDFVISLMGPVTSVDCVAEASTDRTTGGEMIHWTGDITLHLRMASGASATLHASDRAGLFLRQAKIVGSGATLVLQDGGYELFATDGKLLDHSQLTPPSARWDAVTVIAQQWRWLMNQRFGQPYVPAKQIWATAQAAWLSARTGESESPQRWLEMRADV